MVVAVTLLNLLTNLRRIVKRSKLGMVSMDYQDGKFEAKKLVIVIRMKRWKKEWVNDSSYIA